MIGKVTCGACGGEAHVREGKGGTLSVACQAADCKTTAFVKSPSAVAKLRARLAGTSSSGAPDADAGKKKPSFGETIFGEKAS